MEFGITAGGGFLPSTVPEPSSLFGSVTLFSLHRSINGPYDDCDCDDKYFRHYHITPVAKFWMGPPNTPLPVQVQRELSTLVV